MPQAEQLKNPDARITSVILTRSDSLAMHADMSEGLSRGDLEQFDRCFWEIREIAEPWAPIVNSPAVGLPFDGREMVFLWEGGAGALANTPSARIQGQRCWGRDGVHAGRTGQIRVTHSVGEIHAQNCVAIVPKNPKHLAAITAFVSSPDYVTQIRKLNEKIIIPTGVVGQVPFDLAHWQKVAAEKYPGGLPEPQSDDPTQWLFHGHPGRSGVPPLSFSSTEGQDKRQDAASTPLSSASAAVTRLSDLMAEEDKDKRQDAASTSFYDPDAPTGNLKGNLPHWRQKGVVYFVTWRTADSLPQEKLDKWKRDREAWLLRNAGEPKNPAEALAYAELFTDTIEEWLEAGHGACVFRRPEIRKIVEDAMKHFDGQRYTLEEFVVAPNHVHVLVTPHEGHTLSEIMHSWRSFTSKEINKALGQTGEFWQKESFDHIVRSPGKMEKFRKYIRAHDDRRSGVPPLASYPSSSKGEDKRQDAASTANVLQVAVARLVGYRWPAELDTTMRLAPEARAWVERCKDLESHADDDGVVPLVPINKEQPGAERVRALLEAAFGPQWTPGLLNDLLAAAGSAGKSLDEWVKHEFFAQHCAMFHHRPFVWQIWDGKKDGFNILVHYHRLAEGEGKGKKLLEKIVYTYLGDWITQQQAAAKQGAAGADLRLKAAQDLQKKLEAIIAGEPPYDIFVRWKPLHEQPIGWNPDINDGVRMNIRPFVTAGVLRGKVNVKWTKDRGKEPQSIRPKAQFPWFWSCPEENPPTDFAAPPGAAFTGERLNDLHYTNKAKQAARQTAAAKTKD